MNIRSKFPGADTQTQLSRRTFLTVTALGTAGFLIGCGDGQEAAKTAEGTANTILNAFISINSDDTVTVLNKHIEFGQGTTTGVTTLVAEELDAAWGQMRFGFAPADNKLYGNDLMGGMQGTGGSSAMADSFEKYRKAAAGARAMLVQSWRGNFGCPRRHRVDCRRKTESELWRFGRRRGENRTARRRHVEVQGPKPIPLCWENLCADGHGGKGQWIGEVRIGLSP